MSGKSEITFAERRLRRERGVWMALLGFFLVGLFATCASAISSSHRSVSAAGAGSISQTTTETKSTSTSKKRGAPWKKVR